LTLLQKVAATVAALVLVAGLLVWLRIDLGEQVFAKAKLWFYDNYGLSEAWSSSLAIVVAALVVANTWFIIAAVFFGWHKLLALAATVVIAVAAAALFEYRSADQCFHRRSGAPLCTLYRAADGTLVVRRTDAAAPPATWRPVRVASADDVVRYGATKEDRDRRKPKRLDIASCGRDTQFFDSETGEVLVYYVLREGAYEFFSAPGFHPVTAEQLRPVDKSAIPTICKALAQRAERIPQTSAAAKPPEAQPAAAMSLRAGTVLRYENYGYRDDGTLNIKYALEQRVAPPEVYLGVDHWVITQYSSHQYQTTTTKMLIDQRLGTIARYEARVEFSAPRDFGLEGRTIRAKAYESSEVTDLRTRRREMRFRVSGVDGQTHESANTVENSRPSIFVLTKAAREGDYQAIVTGPSDVVVPAGTFKCFVVRRTEGQQEYTEHYDAVTGFRVKDESRISRGGTWRLVYRSELSQIVQ